MEVGPQGLEKRLYHHFTQRMKDTLCFYFWGKHRINTGKHPFIAGSP